MAYSLNLNANSPAPIKECCNSNHSLLPDVPSANHAPSIASSILLCPHLTLFCSTFRSFASYWNFHVNTEFHALFSPGSSLYSLYRFNQTSRKMFVNSVEGEAWDLRPTDHELHTVYCVQLCTVCIFYFEETSWSPDEWWRFVHN